MRIGTRIPTTVKNYHHQKEFSEAKASGVIKKIAFALKKPYKKLSVVLEEARAQWLALKFSFNNPKGNFVDVRV